MSHEPRFSPACMSRRSLLLGACALPLATAAKAAPAPLRIAALDYGIATTLLALGIVPVGVAAAADWSTWVVEPALPPSVVDLGSDLEVNLEVLASLSPDLILTTPYLAALTPTLERIAPVMMLTIYADGADPLPRAIAGTRKLGGRLGAGNEVDTFLADAERFFDVHAHRLAQLEPRPLALVNFMDARHVRIYGRHSLYADVMERVGVDNAWTGPTNYWGFQTIAIEELARVPEESRLIAFEPLPPDVRPTLDRSPLWKRLPFVASDRVSTLPGVLMFGMVPSAMRFAALIADHLEALAE